MMKEPSEVEKLRNQVFVLEQEIVEQRALANKLSQQIRLLGEGDSNIFGSVKHRCYERELMYWVDKCQRQRWAINHIQRRGWYPPAYVIHEELDPREELMSA